MVSKERNGAKGFLSIILTIESLRTMMPLIPSLGDIPALVASLNSSAPKRRFLKIQKPDVFTRASQILSKLYFTSCAFTKRLIEVFPKHVSL